MIVADTDVLIDYLADRAPAAERIALELKAGRLGTTAVTRFELMAGARSDRQTAAIHDLLEALTTLPLDEAAGDAAAKVRRELEREGQPIGMGDSLIAGIVLAHDGVLLTRNQRHFERVGGLVLGRWGAEG